MAYTTEATSLGYGQVDKAYASMGEAKVQPATPTLVRALTSLDELNKRLRQICAGMADTAQQIGGPYPVTGQIKGTDVPQPAAGMARLNDGISEAHGTVSDLENALAAMRRALGA